MNLINLLIRLDSNTMIEVYQGGNELYSGALKDFVCDKSVLDMQVNSILPQHTSRYNYLEIHLF